MINTNLISNLSIIKKDLFLKEDIKYNQKLVLVFPIHKS